MPYGISQNQSDCNAWATVKINPDGSKETIGCHIIKQDAIDHMVAAGINTGAEIVGEVRNETLTATTQELIEINTNKTSVNTRRAVDLSPPNYMRDNAKRGLELHEQGLSGDGIVAQTVEDARKMASGVVTEEKWRKIAPWIARHLSDLDNVKEGEVTAGVVAHLLWGSNGTKSGAIKTMNYAQSIIDQMESNKVDNTTDVRAIIIDGSGEVVDDYNTEEPVEEEMDEEATDLEVCVEATVTIPASWVVAMNGNRNIAYSNIELRAMTDGKTLVGYAAIFDSPSEPLPWTEFVRRGAFRKTIKDGADVRLLIDHEGVPLARTKSGTLTLSEDEVGLRIEAELDETNPDAAKVISALRRGDLSQMSFAFQTVKDAWSQDRQVRELKEVRLFDVSVVTYPAYEQTVAELRSANNTVADTVIAVSPLALRKRQIQLSQMQAEH
jgi:HK97 family phage prohead protease